MKAKLASMILGLLFALLTGAGYAGSATWNVNPTSGDWNTAANWTPETVPNGALDVATFGGSTRTTISLTSDIEVNEIVFSQDANGYAITPNLNTPSTDLIISGAGITNNSGQTQNFRVAASGSRNSGIVFTNSATVASDVVITLQGNMGNGSQQGYVYFMDTSNAGSATLIVTPSTGGTAPGFTFYENSSAANCTFVDVDNGGTAARRAAACFFLIARLPATVPLPALWETLGSPSSVPAGMQRLRWETPVAPCRARFRLLRVQPLIKRILRFLVAA